MSSFFANVNGNGSENDRKKVSAVAPTNSAPMPKSSNPLPESGDPLVSALSQAAKKSKGAIQPTAPVRQEPPVSPGTVMPTSAAPTSPVQATKSAPNYSEVSYTDPSGKQQTGYLINGTTYADPAGSTPVGAGSIVTLASGERWYKGVDGSYKVTGNPTQVTYTDANGASHIGYVINGTTYTDPIGKNPIATGSTVTLPDGTQWYKGENGSQKVTQQTSTVTGAPYSDLSGLINQVYDSGDQMIRDTVNYQTQQGVDQLNRALRDAQPDYAAAIANQLLEAKQAQDAQAYRNQLNGDRGGIGSAQVDSIGNTGAKNREAIAQQQRQLATDTARQIADLRAQGKYEEADKLLQNNQARLSALYNEQVRLQSEEKSRTEQLAALGQSYMSAGIMPNQAMLDAMGIDVATAKLYVDFVKGQMSSGGSTVGSGDGTKKTPAGGDDDKKVTDPSAYQAYITKQMKDGLDAIISGRLSAGTNAVGQTVTEQDYDGPSPYTTTGSGIAGFNSFMANLKKAIDVKNMAEVDHMMEEYFGRFSKSQWDQVFHVLKEGKVLNDIMEKVSGGT